MSRFLARSGSSDQHYKGYVYDGDPCQKRLRLFSTKENCKNGIYSPLICLNSILNYKEVQNNIVKSRHLGLEK